MSPHFVFIALLLVLTASLYTIGTAVPPSGHRHRCDLDSCFIFLITYFHGKLNEVKKRCEGEFMKNAVQRI